MLETANTPIPWQIEQDLLDEIVDGKLSVGDQIDTSETISRRYGVSVSTVGKAISSLASKGYLKRIQRRGTFVANWEESAGRRDVNVKPDNISLVYPDASRINHSSSFHIEFMTCVASYAEQNRFHLVCSAMPHEGDLAVPLAIRRKRIAGIVLLDGLSLPEIDVLKTQGLPMIFCGRPTAGCSVPFIGLDYRSVVYGITQRLLALDRGDVWLTIEPSHLVSYSHEMLDGYQEALMEVENSAFRVNAVMDPALGFGPVEKFASMIQQMKASGQEHFCLIVQYCHVMTLLEAMARGGIAIERTTIVAIGRKLDWPHADRIIFCGTPPRKLASECVRRIIQANESGLPSASKLLSFCFEETDDPVRPFEVHLE